MPSLAVHLSSCGQSPLANGAQSILGILLDIERLLRETGVLQIIESQISLSESLDDGLLVKPKSVSDQVNDTTLARKKLSRQLTSAIPWPKRVKHDAAPWRQSNRQRLENKLQELVYWNDTLYNFLPANIKDSIIRQGISGYVLVDPDDAMTFSGFGHGAMSQQARLFEAYRKLMNSDSMGSIALDELGQRLIDAGFFDLIGVDDDEPFSIVHSFNDQQASLIEWYKLPETTVAEFELHSIACERLAKLSVLLSAENKPSTLCAAESIGYVKADNCHRIGLVSRIPDGISTATRPVSLYSLLCRKPLPAADSRAPLATLGQRFTLASILTNSLYTFMLARWHHKMFNSLNIHFMFSKTDSILPDLNNPHIGGYSISRPSALEEISICGTQTSLSETYLHPQLRVSAHERPSTWGNTRSTH